MKQEQQSHESIATRVMALVVKQEIEFKRNKMGSGSYKKVVGTTPTSEDNALTPVNTDLKTLDEERH